MRVYCTIWMLQQSNLPTTSLPPVLLHTEVMLHRSAGAAAAAVAVLAAATAPAGRRPPTKTAVRRAVYRAVRRDCVVPSAESEWRRRPPIHQLSTDAAISAAGMKQATTDIKRTCMHLQLAHSGDKCFTKAVSRTRPCACTRGVILDIVEESARLQLPAYRARNIATIYIYIYIYRVQDV